MKLPNNINLINIEMRQLSRLMLQIKQALRKHFGRFIY